jgi:hypothetical protein
LSSGTECLTFKKGGPNSFASCLGFALTLDIVGAALGCLLAYAGMAL